MLTFLYALNLTWELKNTLSSHHFSPLINQPTRETKSSNTIIDNIPCPFDMCDIGILCPYISDHKCIFLHIKEYHIK